MNKFVAGGGLKPKGEGGKRVACCMNSVLFLVLVTKSMIDDDP